MAFEVFERMGGGEMLAYLIQLCLSRTFSRFSLEQIEGELTISYFTGVYKSVSIFDTELNFFPFYRSTMYNFRRFNFRHFYEFVTKCDLSPLLQKTVRMCRTFFLINMIEGFRIVWQC